jgi:hypothetical protein
MLYLLQQQAAGLNRQLNTITTISLEREQAALFPEAETERMKNMG